MAALYWRRPTAEQLAGTGLKPKHYKEPEVEVWPENWGVLQLFIRYSTQWRMGGGGPVGLDYAVIQHDLGRMGLSDDDYLDMMDRLRVIEQAALEHIHSE